jgi:hypothetical protein
MLFITHQLPQGLQVDEAVVLGKAAPPSNSQAKSANTPVVASDRGRDG